MTNKIMTDDQLKLLEDEWLKTRADSVLSKMYIEFVKISRVLFKSHLKKIGFISQDLEILIHDSVTRLIANYLTKSDFTCPIRSRLYNEMLWQLYNVRKKKRDAVRQIGDYDNYTKCWEHKPIHLKQILDHPNGWDIVRVLKKPGTYKTAILEINTFIPKRWIYDHAIELRILYKGYRNGKKKSSCLY